MQPILGRSTTIPVWRKFFSDASPLELTAHCGDDDSQVTTSVLTLLHNAWLMAPRRVERFFGSEFLISSIL